jgi:hypothetical protein
MKPTAFHIPSKSVMAGAKPYKPGALNPCNYFRVVGRPISQAENDRRSAMRKASI